MHDNPLVKRTNVEAQDCTNSVILLTDRVAADTMHYLS